MSRYSDIDPQDIDPDTGRPYSNYSSPALDTAFHDGEMDVDGDDPQRADRAIAMMPEMYALVTEFFLAAPVDRDGMMRVTAEQAKRARAILARIDGSGAVAENATDDEDDGYPGKCSNPGGHGWVVSDETDRSYCQWCGADGDA